MTQSCAQVALGDEEALRQEREAERAKAAQERLAAAYAELQAHGDKARDMKEQEMLRLQMQVRGGKVDIVLSRHVLMCCSLVWLSTLGCCQLTYGTAAPVRGLYGAGEILFAQGRSGAAYPTSRLGRCCLAWLGCRESDWRPVCVEMMGLVAAVSMRSGMRSTKQGRVCVCSLRTGHRV